MLEFKMIKSKRRVKCAECDRNIFAGQDRLLQKISSVSVNFCKNCSEDIFTEKCIEKAKNNAKNILNEKIIQMQEDIKKL